jgi:hypothetical protein
MAADSKRLEVGTKVRVLHTDYDEIPVGTVTHIIRAYDENASLWCKEYPDGLFFFGREFEVIADNATNAAPKFAVGDMVRLRVDDVCGDYKKGDVVNVVEVDDCGVSFDDDEGDLRYLSFSDVEPVAVATQPQPTIAPLTIRAGRYYKTRDGRKVGPMRKDGNDWSAPGVTDFGKLWLNDGSRYFIGNGHDHLVAEWVDEPAATNADIFDDLEDWMADNPLPVIDTSTTGFTVPLDAPEFGGKLDATAPTLDDLYAAKCMVETGVCTINEVRKHLGLGPVPRGHELARAA